MTVALSPDKSNEELQRLKQKTGIVSKVIEPYQQIADVLIGFVNEESYPGKKGWLRF